MQHKRLKLSAVLLLGLGLTVLQAQTIYVRAKIGTQTAYTLSDIKKMSFSSGNISVTKTAGGTDSYALTDIRYLNFTNLITSVAIAEQQEKHGKVHLYPNPVSDVLYIQLANSEWQSSVLEILSINGKVLYKESLKQNMGIQKVNLFDLPKGFYLCRINNESTVETVKFIKQ